MCESPERKNLSPSVYATSKTTISEKEDDEGDAAVQRNPKKNAPRAGGLLPEIRR
jgi:hypothetical protein